MRRQRLAVEQPEGPALLLLLTQELQELADVPALIALSQGLRLLGHPSRGCRIERDLNRIQVIHLARVRRPAIRLSARTLVATRA